MLGGSIACAATAEQGVPAKRKAADPWKVYPTTTLSDLTDFQPGKSDLDAFGGLADKKIGQPGFFRVAREAGRWRLIDPLGNAFVSMAVVDVNVGSSRSRDDFKQNYRDLADWAEKTSTLLRGMGFNGTGCWSDDADLSQAPHPLIYTPYLGLMESFGHSRGLTHPQPGHSGYPNDCIPVFHPDFEPFVKARVAKLLTSKDDPHLLGYFSDNELPYPFLAKYLALDPNDPGMASSYTAARQWWTSRKGSGADVKSATPDDVSDFAQFVYERYYGIVQPAIKAVDPNHLFLGSRLHSWDYERPGAWRAATKYVDVCSINYYGAWWPDAPHLEKWMAWSGRPFMVTEWYARGDDVGFANSSGAGWIVPTQADRGKFYQNFTLGLLACKGCVGWHWFKYRDNDPSDTSTDPSNRDSNKGLVNLALQPYKPLADDMAALNSQAYRLMDYFDRK